MGQAGQEKLKETGEKMSELFESNRERFAGLLKLILHFRGEG
jgi:hypothetical protein